MAQLDSSVVLVALPQMAGSFGVHPVDLSIGITIYILAQALLLPSSSWVADRWGARRVFALALVGFTLASVLCALSRSLPQFIAARVLQGAAAALMTPVARIILLQSARKEDLIGVITISTVPMLIAPTLGPPVGGIIVTYLSWPWIFLLNLPVGIAGVLLVLRFIEPRPAPAPRPFDWIGFGLTAAASCGVLLGLTALSESSAAWQRGLALTVAGGVCGWLAVRHLRRHPHPVLSLAVLRVRTYAVTTLGGGLLVRLPVRALPFVLPLMFQVGLGYSAFAAGVLLLALNGGDLLLKLIVSRSLRRYGYRRVLLASSTLMLLATAGCALYAGPGLYWIVGALLIVSGMGRSLLFSGLSTLAFADVPHEELGSASVLWNLLLQLTNALAVSIAAIVLNATALASGASAAHVSVLDCRLALLALTAVGALSLYSFARLPPEAGAHLSGHGAASAAQQPPAGSEGEYE